MSAPAPGVLPPVDTWHPQVRAWVHAAWTRAEQDGRGSVALSDLVNALWAAGDPWSRAYRHLFGGSPPRSRRPSVVPDDVFYAADADLVELVHRAAALGGGRVTPWAVLGLVAARTASAARDGRPGARGVWTAPVVAEREDGQVVFQRGASVEQARTLAAGRQLVVLLVDDRLSSASELFATPYVEGQFDLVAEDTFVLRQPAQDGFWVLEGVAPDAPAHLDMAIRELRRRVPGALPWAPLKRRVGAAGLDLLTTVLTALRAEPRLLLSSEPGDNALSDDQGADPLVVALDRLTRTEEGVRATPLLPDLPGPVDAFGRTALATALAASLAMQETDLPLTLAVLGESGTGRTDLLERLRTAWVDLEGAPRSLRAKAAPDRVHVALHAPDLHHEALAASALALLRALDGPLPTPPAEPAPPPTRPTLQERLLHVLVPGAPAEDVPTGVLQGGRTGGALLAFGLAGLMATPGPWALLPAALMGLGAFLVARAIGRGVLAPAAEPEPTAVVPRPPEPPEVLLEAHLGGLDPAPRLLVTLDDLDHCPPHRAREVLDALEVLLLRSGRPPTVLALACSPETLDALGSVRRPATTRVQLPCWLGPVSPRTSARALSTWTGLDAPTVATPPRLAPVEDGPVPDPVPISIELEDAGTLVPDDLRALHGWLALTVATPRVLKRLTNQFRLVRATQTTSLPADAVAFWLTLAEGAPETARSLGEWLVLDDGEDVDAWLSHGEARSFPALEQGKCPTASDLRDTIAEVLPWTFVGPISAAARRAAHPAAPRVPRESRRSARLGS